MSQYATGYPIMNISLLEADGTVASSQCDHHCADLATEFPAGIGIIPGAP